MRRTWVRTVCNEAHYIGEVEFTPERKVIVSFQGHDSHFHLILVSQSQGVCAMQIADPCTVKHLGGLLRVASFHALDGLRRVARPRPLRCVGLAPRAERRRRCKVDASLSAEAETGSRLETRVCCVHPLG